MGRIIVAGGSRAAVPVAGVPLGTIAEGQIIKLRENGTQMEFYVAKHNYEPTLNGNGRTLLVRKLIHPKMQFSTASARYTGSNIDNYLQNTYAAALDAAVSQAAAGTKFLSYLPNVTATQCTVTHNVLTRKAFTLSYTELTGNSIDTYTYNSGDESWWKDGFVYEGQQIPIASSLLTDSNIEPFTRTWACSPSNTDKVYVVYDRHGGGALQSYTSSYPFFIGVGLPATTLFNPKTMEFKGAA